MVPIGLKADDLIPEENDIVQTALKRLPPKEAYDRVFRLRRAFQVRSAASHPAGDLLLSRATPIKTGRFWETECSVPHQEFSLCTIPEPPLPSDKKNNQLTQHEQCSLAHQLLPPNEQTKAEEDKPYLSPIIEEIEAEMKERADMESMTVQRKT